MWKQLRSIQKSDSRKYNNPSSKFTKHYPRFPISNNRESTRESSTISQAGQSIFEKGESSPPPLFELHIVEYLSSTTIFYPKRVNLLRFQACFQILGTVKEERLHSKRVASSHRKRKSNKGIRNPESEDGSEQIESKDIPFKNLI